MKSLIIFGIAAASICAAAFMVIFIFKVIEVANKELLDWDPDEDNVRETFRDFGKFSVTVVRSFSYDDEILYFTRELTEAEIYKYLSYKYGAAGWVNFSSETIEKA